MKKHAGGEIVLVTGASSGIGRELARYFAADGSRLILLARKRSALESLAEELRKSYKTQSEVLTIDLAQPDAPDRIYRHLDTQGTRLDVLVNNAGFGANGLFAELSLERQMEMIQVNVTSAARLMRLFLPGMIQRGRGGVLNVASTAAFQPGPEMAVYYATKAFLLSLSEAVGDEVRGTGVAVTALCPGATSTNFFEAAGAQESRLFRFNAMSAEAVARIGHKAFRKKQSLCVAGLRNKAMAASVRFAPRLVVRKIARFINHTKLM